MALSGKTILTTRAVSQSGELRQKLEALGARVIECPTIEIVPVDDWSAVDIAVAAMNTYNWLLFTSANAVEHFMKRAALAHVTCKIPVAVVGPATARRLREWRLEPALVPKEFRADGLLQALPESLFQTSILFPRAEIARENLPTKLRQRGARVDVITVYRTLRPGPDAPSIADVLAREKIDCIVFTSPSTIRYLAEAVGETLLEVLKDVKIAVIGPVTRDAAVEFGLNASITPSQSTMDQLVVALDRCL